MTHIEEQKISGHYGRGGLLQKITDGLTAAGKNVQSLIVDDLAAVDALHTRGRESTVELAELGEFSAEHSVLDVGCGLGGSARFLASRYSCQVTGVDLTNEFIDVAKELTSWVDLAKPPEFQQASALNLPFEDARFDVVWTEHVQMNISDKETFYSEIGRVLKPGGRLLFHDIFAADEPVEAHQPSFPVPWAEDASHSSLASEREVRAKMADAGLAVTSWENKISQSIDFFNKVLDQLSAKGPPPIGIHLLMGEPAKTKITNYFQALQNGKLSVILGIAEKYEVPDHG